MTAGFAEPLLFAARFLIGALFIVGGLRHFPLLDAITPALAARKIPFPRFVLIFGSVYEIVFGVALALGLFVTLSAFALILFTVVASLMLVNFWDNAEPERSMLFGVFMSNIAIIGGLLAVVAAGHAG